jgi:hypothetical protein
MASERVFLMTLVQRNSAVSFSSLSMKVFFSHSSMFIALTDFRRRRSRASSRDSPSTELITLTSAMSEAKSAMMSNGFYW